MWEFFGHFKSLEVFIGGFTVLGFLTAWFFIGKPFVKIGDKIMIGFSRGQKRTIPHIGCSYNGDFKKLMVKTIESMDRYFEIKYIKLLDTQMSIVKENQVRIKTMMLGAFGRALMSKSDIKDLIRNEDYIQYNDLITMMLDVNIHELFYHSFKQNNITRKTDEEFRVYVDKKAEVIFDTGSLFMDSHYIGSKMIVDREELRKFNAEIRDEIVELTKDVFYSARKVAIEIKEEMDDILNSLDEYCGVLDGSSQGAIERS